MILYDRKLTNSISTHRPLCPMSSGASDQSQGASERAQRSAIAKRAVRRKQMSERCESKSDWRIEGLSTLRVFLLYPLCNGNRDQINEGRLSLSWKIDVWGYHLLIDNLSANRICLHQDVMWPPVRELNSSHFVGGWYKKRILSTYLNSFFYSPFKLRS